MEQIQQTLNVNYRSGGKFYPLALSGIIFCLTAPTYGQWPKHIIDDEISTAVSVDVADMDGDTKLDLVVTNSGRNEIILYQNNFPHWIKHTIAANASGVTFAFIGDMDGNDTLDVVACLYNSGKMVWYENNHPTWPQHIIDGNTDNADFMLVEDIDGDDTLDVITAGGIYGGGDVVWYENNHPDWIEHIIESGASETPVLCFNDIDGDGLLDVVATRSEANKVVWYKNEGNGLSWTKYTIDDNLNAAWGLSSGNIDGDSTIDLVATAGGPYYDGSDVVWYENHHPTWTKHVIDANLLGANIAYVTDVDGDDTMDVIVDGFDGDVVVWYENNHPTWTQHVIDANLDGPRVFAVSDVDGDRINDLIVPATGSVVWYKNPYTTVAYVKSFEVYPKYIPPQQGDTLKLSAQISNPENHQVIVDALIQGKNSTFKDSLQLFDDGLHDDGIASDSIFGVKKCLDQLDEDYIDVELRTIDSTESITMYCVNKGHFTTIGPVEYAADSLVEAGTAPNVYHKIYLTLRNTGSTATASGVMARLSALDTCVTTIHNSQVIIGDIPAGEAVMSSSFYPVSFNQNCPVGTEVPFALSISSEGYEFWSDTFDVTIIPPLEVADAGTILPNTYALHQNYPNPFNPVSTIRYDLPQATDVSLIVYDILGREVRTLVAGMQEPGYKSVVWDGRNQDGIGLPSSIYITRLLTPEYSKSIKMLLLK